MPDIVAVGSRLQEAVLLHQSGQLKQAATIYQRVLDIEPENADALHLLGLVSHQSGQPESAITLIKQALDISPNQLNFLHNLANILRELGQFEEAVQVYRQLIRLRPDTAETYNNLGISLHKLNQFQPAAQAYRDAIELNPEYDQAYSNLAATLIKLKRLDEAIGVCLKALEISSDNFTIYCNLGNIYRGKGMFEEAIKSYQQAIRIQPNVAEVHSNLGDVFKESNRLDEAIQTYQRAIDIRPNIAQVYSNIGSILYEKLVKLDNGSDFYTRGAASLTEPSYLRESIRHYRQAVKIDPDCSAEVYNNLGVALGKQRELDQSARAYQTALRINPEYAEAHCNLGTLLLLQGDFVDGWSEYEWRWKCSKFPSRKPNFLQPIWNGSNLNGKSILVWTEQGMGDQMMFASMFHPLLQMDVKVVVECPKRLTSLFNRSFPFSCISKSNPPGQELLDSSIDYQTSIGSLARWLLLDEESFPKNPSYLKACADKTGELRDEYQKLAPGKFLVGISWKSVNKDMGKLKSTSLIQWTGLLSRKDCFFINLQYGDVEEEIEAFTGQTGISVYQDKEINSLESLDNFSAQVSALDLVISTSNTTVHMAGALGKPVWTLLHYVPDWRWQLDRSDTLWYPSMKLYRQPSLGDWDSVFQQVQSDLGKFVDQTLMRR